MTIVQPTPQSAIVTWRHLPVSVSLCVGPMLVGWTIDGHWWPALVGRA